MTYEIYLNDNLLYYPNEPDYAVFNSKLETALNEAGTLEFDIPKNNMRYADFDDGGQLRSGIVTVLKDGEEIFCGEVREVTQNFDFTKHVYAVGELAYLFDSIQPQARYQGTVLAMFTSLLTNHNNQVEARKRFTVGNVLVDDPNGYIYHYTNREDTLTDLRDKLCNTLNGYLKIRKVSGVKYLDFVPLSSYGSYCTQEIQFGENMLDYSANYTADDIATCVIPLGVRLEDNQRTAYAVEGLDEYLTIRNTAVDAYHTNKNDDYVYIQSAVNRFGWVRVVKHWDDVTVAENLKTKAEQWLTDAQFAKLELNLNAIDLSLMDSDIDSFEVGDTIHAWAEPYNMDTTFPVRKKTVYLNDLSKNFIVLGNTTTTKSYTKQQSDAVRLVEEAIPQAAPWLEESKKQALTMLLDETQGGYVVYEYRYNSAGQAVDIEAINICNNRTIDLSTSRWRWSYNGLGFMTRANPNAPWSSATAALALTNDGKINANRILTGTLDADTVQVHGRIEATSGYIGTEGQGWNIASASIQNGVTGMNDNSHAGTYVGVDGIRFNQKPTDPTPLAYTKITRLGIECQTTITSTGALYGGNIYSGNGKQIIARASNGTNAVKLDGSTGTIDATGKITTQGSIGAAGSIVSSSNITASGNISSSSGNIGTNDGYFYCNGIPGKTNTYYFKDGNGDWQSLKFEGGLLVGTSL